MIGCSSTHWICLEDDDEGLENRVNCLKAVRTPLGCMMGDYHMIEKTSVQSGKESLGPVGGSYKEIIP